MILRVSYHEGTNLTIIVMKTGLQKLIRILILTAIQSILTDGVCLMHSSFRVVVPAFNPLLKVMVKAPLRWVVYSSKKIKPKLLTSITLLTIIVLFLMEL